MTAIIALLDTRFAMYSSAFEGIIKMIDDEVLPLLS
jgi:hypothetical protein